MVVEMVAASLGGVEVQSCSFGWFWEAMVEVMGATEGGVVFSPAVWEPEAREAREAGEAQRWLGALPPPQQVARDAPPPQLAQQGALVEEEVSWAYSWHRGGAPFPASVEGRWSREFPRSPVPIRSACYSIYTYIYIYIYIY